MTVQDNAVRGMAAQGNEQPQLTPWHSLPQEMRDRPQWLLAAHDAKGALKVPTTIDEETGQLAPGSSTNRATWLTFPYAVACALERGLGIGFVVCDDDPFTCIDFDVKNAANEPDATKHTSAAHIAAMQGIAQDLTSYTELSQSGQGVHVWVYAKFPGEGAKHKGVEVYCRDRFLVCTGNHVAGFPLAIAPQQEEVEQLIATIRAAQAASGQRARASALEDGAEELDDNTLMTRAWDADNRDKFQALWRGEWVQLGYPSQSEGDLALMAMLCFYSRSSEQVKRLFRNSALGQREKANKNDRYLDFSLRLIRGRQREDEEGAARAAAAVQALRAQHARQAPNPGPQQPQTGQPAPAPQEGAATPQALAHPPGKLGELSHWVESKMPQPIREVAVVTALAVVHGITGMQYRTYTDGGLNTMLILLARSGVGKQHLQKAIGQIRKILRESLPGSDSFFSGDDHMSGPAFAKAMVALSGAKVKDRDDLPTGQGSHVNTLPELGKKIRDMADTRNPAMASLRVGFTRIYSQSDRDTVDHAINYSGARMVMPGGVAYTLVGEGTPLDLYCSLTTDMADDGFFSRLEIFEYAGDVEDGEGDDAAIDWTMPEELKAAIGNLVTQVMTMRANNRFCVVPASAEARQILRGFDLECKRNIRAAGDNEMLRACWTRARFRAMKRGTAGAAFDNPHGPQLSAEAAKYAVDLARQQAQHIATLIHQGDVGNTDAPRQKALEHMLRVYVNEMPKPSYKGWTEETWRVGLVSWTYLTNRAQHRAAFKSADRNKGYVDALQHTMKWAESCGMLPRATNGQIKEHELKGEWWQITLPIETN